MVAVMMFIAVLAYNRLSGSGHAEAQAEGQKTLSATGITNLDIETTADDIEVVPGDQDQIVALLDGDGSKNGYTFDVVQDGQTARINLNGASSLFNFQMWDEGTTLKVTVPQKDWDQLTVKTSSGDITLSDLKARTLDVQSSSGDQHLNGLQISDQATVSSSSGDITARTNTINHATWETTSGDIDSEQLDGQQAQMQTSSGDIRYVQSKLAPDVQLTTSSGDVDAKLTGDTNALQIESNSSSGTPDIDIDGMQLQDRSDGSTLGTKGQGEAKYHLKIDTSSGDVEVSE